MILETHRGIIPQPMGDTPLFVSAPYLMVATQKIRDGLQETKTSFFLSLFVPPARTCMVQTQAFAILGPLLWNQLLPSSATQTMGRGPIPGRGGLLTGPRIDI